MIDNEYIRQLRAKTGLSQASFAKKLSLHQSVIAMIESDKRTVPKSVIYAVERIYGNKDIPDGIENNKTDDNLAKIPFYNIGAAAGAGTWLLDEPEKEELYFDSRWLKNVLKVSPHTLHCIFASGDSMDSGFANANAIKDGDLLLVDTSNTTGNNGIFVIRVNNSELRVKRLVKKLDGSLTIISDNPKYPEETYYPNESDYTVEILGKVVWNGSKENI